MNNIFIEYLPPWVETGLQPAFYDKESGTVLQQTARMYAKVNALIEAFNKLSSDTKAVVEEYIAKFEELYTYVHDYFDNLDVQEEINNKLDAMADAGTLQEIITTYIQSNVAWTFDTVADMKLATNLVDGSFAQTLGFRAKGDGGGAIYKISDSGTADEMAVIAIGDLYATIVVPEVATPEMFGAYGDKTHDDTNHLQLAINLADDVKLDKEYCINGSLSLKDGTHLFGIGTIYQPNNIDEKLINIDSVKGIIIEGLTICNENGQSGTPASYGGQYLIWAEDSSDIVIRDCHFKNAYKRGIEIFKCKDIVYDNNTFVNATFDMLLLHPEVENVQVTNSVFDTITSNLSLAYLFATGGDDPVTVFAFATKNILIDNCKFLNNTKWEGIDTHGCVGFTCTNNYIYNCYRGIMASSGGSVKTEITDQHGDIVIKNNTLVGTDNSTTHGIITGGYANLYVRNIVVEENNIDNWGGTTTNQSSISVDHARYININNNIVTNSRGSSVYTADVINGNVCGNEFIDSAGGYATSIYSGSWFINFAYNKIKTLKVQKQNAINYQGIVNIHDNDIQGYNQPWYGKKTNMTGLVNQYTTQMGKSGDYVRNGYQLITHYCTDAVVRANKAETMSFTATINNGTDVVETSAKYTYDLCEGEEVVIAGAGSGGADLTTILTEVIDETHFKVKDMASTGVTGADLSVTASTWVAV